MEYPHRRYLIYLISRRLSDGEIGDACQARMLAPPTDLDLQKLRREVGGIPPYWLPDLAPGNAKLYRWVRDRKVLDLWKAGRHQREAGDFLFAMDSSGHGPRCDFQHLLLLEWNVEKAREQLVLKYGETRIPDVEALVLYAEYFWNLPAMSQTGIFAYLDALDENETELAAYSGDLTTTYGFLGLRQQIQDEEFYDNVIALANAEIQVARRKPGSLSGQKLMAVAGLAKVADSAIQARRDLRTAGLGDTIKTELAAFRLRKRKRVQAIPSYEDLLALEEEGTNGNIIDIKADVG